MGNRVTSVRIKRPDGTYSNEIPISPSADKVIWKDNEHNLEEILGNVDTTKPIQNQINQKVNTAELQEYIDTEMADDVGDWLEEHVIIPSGGTVAVDNTLSISEAAADSKTVGDIIDQSIAPRFSTENNYKKDDYVFYNNHLYRFIVDHTAGNDLNTETQVEVADNVTKQIQQVSDKIGNGNYEEMCVGTADQLISDNYVVEQEPYQFRKSGGSALVGTRMEDCIVGGSIVWNQLVQNGNFENNSYWVPINGSLTINNNIATVTLTDLPVQTFQYVLSAVDHVFFVSAFLKPTVDGVFYLRIGTIRNSPSKTCNSNVWTSISGIKKIAAEDIYSTTTSELNIYARNDSGLSANDSFQIKNVCCFDLTAMFGSTIADYIYSLEQANQGDGVAFFRKFFPKDYYAYNAGELISVSGLSEHKTVGFNIWDEEWEVGGINGTTGNTNNQSGFLRAKNFIRVFPNSQYYINSSGYTEFYIYFYDENKNYIRYWLHKNENITLRGNEHYIKCAYSGGTTYNHDICINLSDPAKNGTYEPYKGHSYPLDDSLTLRGIPKLNSNNQLYFDGDRYLANGVVERKYGIVDLGTLEYQYRTNGGINTFVISGISNIKTNGGLLTLKYLKENNGKTTSQISQIDKAIWWNNSGTGNAPANAILIKDSSYTDAATFKTAMSGVMLVCELATPTTETADPYHNPQIVDPEGTEEYICTSLVPVGHETKYFEDLKGKIENDIGNLSDLTTTAKSNLVAAVNQLNSQVVEVDATLSVQGNAADSKKVGDEITDLKEDLRQNIGRYGQNSFTTVIGSAHSQANDDVKIPLTTGETYYFEFTTSDVLTLVQLVETDSSNNTSTQSSFSPAQGTTKKTYTAKRNAVKVGVYVTSQSVAANVSYKVYTEDGKIFDEIQAVSSSVSEIENAFTTTGGNIKLKSEALPATLDAVNEIVSESFELTPAVATLEIEVIKTNGYMSPDGHTAASTQYAYTQKIPVRENDVIQLRNDVTGTPNTYMRYITAFNGDTAIEAKGSNSNTQSYTVPANINFVVITFDQQAYPNVTVTNLASLYTLVRNAENPDVKKVTSVYDVPEIIVPEKSFAVVGHEWNMYYDNIANKLTDGYYLFCSGINGKSFDRLLRFTPTSDDIGTHTITIGVYAKNLKDVITSKDFDLIVVADSAPTKNVMFIGDSLTEEGTYINEIQNVLSNGSITSIGTRTGTTTPGYSNIHHEGRSGWSAYDLTEKASEGTTTNAFWNPSSEEFDFSYYVETAYPSAVGATFPGVDCVMLNLGTNGANNVKRTCDAISEMITSIHEYDSSIKIIVSLITPPTTQDGCGQHNGMFNANQWKIYELNLIKAYLELYQDVSTNVYVSEPYFNIDRLYDFPTKTVAVSSRNPLQITINDNNVHPSIYGYLKLADVYYANLLYRLS